MSNTEKPNKTNWSKLMMPPELGDMFYMIAKVNGYKRDDAHHFLYHLLQKTYPDDVKKLADYLDTNWLDNPPGK